jgi:drug/metabolite transporter (DMT)-like permease
MITYVKLLLMAVFLRGSFVAGRVIARDVQPISAAFTRFVLASALLLLLTWRVEGRLPGMKRGHIVPIILLGMTGVFGYNVFSKGLQTVGAGRASVIVATNPIFITLSLLLGALLVSSGVCVTKADSLGWRAPGVPKDPFLGDEGRTT